MLKNKFFILSCVAISFASLCGYHYWNIRNEWKVPFNKGITSTASKNYHEALEFYNQSLKLNPNSSVLYANKCLTLYYIDNQQEALNNCNKALKIDGKNLISLNTKGNILIKMGLNQESIEHFKHSLELNFSDEVKSIFYNNAGLAHENLKEYEQSIISFDDSILLKRHNVSALRNKTRVFFKLKQYNEALDNINKVISLAPNVPKYYDNKAVILYKLHKHEELLDTINKSLFLNPNGRYKETYECIIHNSQIPIEELGKMENLEI